MAIAVHGSRVYVAGAFEGSVDFGDSKLTSAGGQDIFLAEFSEGGELRSSQHFGGQGARQAPRALAVDPEGNPYLAGSFDGTLEFGDTTLTATATTDIFLASFTASGAPRWAQNFGLVRYNIAYGVAVAMGRVYLAGSYEGAITVGGPALPYEGVLDAFVASYDASDGTHVWSRGFGGKYHDWAFSIAADAIGNAYVTGFFQETAYFGDEVLVSRGESDIFLSSYDREGTLRWVQPFGGIKCDVGRTVAVAGDVYVAGSFAETVDFGGGVMAAHDGSAAFIASFSPDGAHQWSQVFGGAQADGVQSIAVAPDGAVYSVGMLEATPSDCESKPTGGDIFVMRTSP